MVTAKQDSFTPGEVFAFIFQAQVGIGILSLPGSLADQVGTGAWFTILIAGAIPLLSTLLFWYIAINYPCQSIFQVCKTVFGPWIGRAFMLAFVLSFLAQSISIIRDTLQLINLWLFPETPRWLLASCLVISSLYLANKGIKSIVWFCVVMLPLPLLLPLVSSFFLARADINLLIPIFPKGLFGSLKAVPVTSLAFLGYELVGLILPRCKDINKGFQAAIAANIFTIVSYAAATAAILGRFGPETTAAETYPLLSALRTVVMGFIDRPDIVFFGIWLIVAGTSHVSYLYGAARGIKDIFGLFPFLSLLVAVVINLAPAWRAISYTDLVNQTTLAGVFGQFIAVSIPVLIIVVTLLKKRRTCDETS